jgi:hypothetical protein
MPVFFPSELKNNNPAYATVDATGSRGTAYPLNQLSDTGSIPSDKRKPGMIIFVTGSKEFYGFKGTGSTDTDWNTTSNWGSIGGSTSTAVKSGTVTSFAGTPYSASVTFGTAFSDTLYSVSLTSDIGRVLTVESKLATGFTINTNSSVQPNGNVYWMATAYNNS